MAKQKRLNRTTDMDNALFEALKTRVPEKDTGPDPDDILSGLFDDDEEEASQQLSGKNRDISVTLDDVDRQYAQKIMELVRHQTGEQIDMAEAIKIALSLCSMDEQEIGAAYRGITTRKHCD